MWRMMRIRLLLIDWLVDWGQYSSLPGRFLGSLLRFSARLGGYGRRSNYISMSYTIFHLSFLHSVCRALARALTDTFSTILIMYSLEAGSVKIDRVTFTRYLAIDNKITSKQHHPHRRY